MRDLPPPDALAGELAALTGATAISSPAEGRFPVRALAYAGHHALLVRDHGHVVSVSIPFGDDGHWSLATRKELAAEGAAIARRVAAYVRAAPTAISIADAMLALRAVVPPSFEASFPGTPAPSEGWLREADGPGSIGLFQEGPSVRMVIWAEGSQSRRLTARADLAADALTTFVTESLRRQREVRAAHEAELERQRRLPVPPLADVTAALHAGARVCVGGGRWLRTWYVEGGRLMRDELDEGWTDTGVGRERELAADLAAWPQPFREALGRG